MEDTKERFFTRVRRCSPAWVSQFRTGRAVADGLRGAPEIFGATLSQRPRLRSLWPALRAAPASAGRWLRAAFARPPRQESLFAGPSCGSFGSGLWRLLPEVRRTLSITFGALVLMSLAAWILNLLDPFGVNRNSQAYSEYLYARAEAPFYRSAAQDDIVVVLIRPDTLARRDFAWPPRYEYYAEAVRRIVSQKPRALYVDVLVRRARDYDDTLDYARDEIAWATDEYDVPVIFATETPGAPSLFANDRLVDVAPMAWQAAGDDYPLRLGEDNIVPWGNEHRLQASSCAMESVALRLYRHACPGMLAGPGACPSPGGLVPLQGCGEAGLDTLPADLPHMVVQWGTRRPWLAPEQTPNAAGWREECLRGAEHPGWEARYRSALKALYASLVSGRASEAVARTRETCPYALTITEQQVEDLPQDFLANRVVILGVDLPGLEDSVLTPAHGRLPGAYLHAMALDNLMHHGADYRRRHEWHGFVVDVVTSVLLCLVLALLLRSRLGGHGLLPWLLLIPLAVAIGILSSLVRSHVFHLPASNWVAGAVLLIWAARRVSKNLKTKPTPQPWSST